MTTSRVLEKVHGEKGMWVTVSTGVIAAALEGITIHSATGLKRDPKFLLASVPSHRLFNSNN